MKNFKTLTLLALPAALFFVHERAFARQRLALPQDAPAAAKADPAQLPEGSLSAVLVDSRGVVEAKRPGDAEFSEIAKGAVLPAGTEIATGYDSEAFFAFTGQILVKVPSMTQLTVSTLARDGGTLRSNLSIQFGTLDVDVKKGSILTDLKVATPNSTTSITGTRVVCHYRTDAAGDRSGGGAYHAAVACREGTVVVDSHEDAAPTDRGLPLSGGEATAGGENTVSAGDYAELSRNNASDASVTFGLTDTESGVDGTSNVAIDPTLGVTSPDAGGSGGSTADLQEQFQTSQQESHSESSNTGNYRTAGY